ncbi:MAG TPA: hypothetical protein VGM39_02585 [Kofleriaceae bacterium]
MTLTPVATGDGACGLPSGVQSIRITAFARSGEKIQTLSQMDSVDIDSFPADTEQIGVEVETGVTSRVIAAQGKTPPMDFNDLDDDAAIKVFMAPPNGYCPTVGAMTEPRISPLIARAGDGVLIIGGQGPSLDWLTSAEFYDPRTSTFTPVSVPETFTLDNQLGFAGASLVALPDGRVALTGGPISGLTIFDPTTMKFSAPELIEPRAFHAALALDSDHLLLAGGCASISNGMCGTERVSTRSYTIDNTLMSTLGPNLQAARVGATLFDLGTDDNGTHSYVVAGGSARMAQDPGGADRFTLAAPGMTAPDATLLTGTHEQAAQLDGGSVLTSGADGSSSTIGASTTTATDGLGGPARVDTRLVMLEDGRVLSVGGANDNSVLVYDPLHDRWDEVDAVGNSAPGAAPVLPLMRPSLLRLGDGSVLVLGGLVGGAATSQAWIYRPSLVGPASGAVIVTPTAADSAVLTPVDPTTMARTPEIALVGGGVPARALVGGPRKATGSVTATVKLLGGGVALVAQQLATGSALLGELQPGVAARIVRRDGGDVHVLCSGAIVSPFHTQTEDTIRLEVSGGSARLLLNGEALATCDTDRSDRGAWGVAALVSSQVAIRSVTVDH